MTEPPQGGSAELVERLREGTHEIGMHEDNSTELFDVQGANDVMWEAADTITRLEAEVAQLRGALISEREENLWDAYNSGFEKDGQWTHMFMSTGEWLARECGFDPKLGHYDAAEIKAAIPKAAENALPQPATPKAD